MKTKNPIKFLDAYTRDDGDIFFGRDKETEALYEKVNRAKVVLLYGLSGTGKTSLIQCGLENLYDTSRQTFIYVRRGKNILAAIRNEAEEHADSMIHPDATARQALETVYFDYLTPLIVVFDQFEELFISGTVEEKETFIEAISDMLNSKMKVKVIFSLREEYLALMDEFEESIPSLFDYRMRIEKMRRATLEEVIAHIAEKGEVKLESENIPGLIIDNISDKKGYVELPYLQVYLDKLMRLSIKENKGQVFNATLVYKAGKLEDVLGDFLDEQITQIAKITGSRKYVENVLKVMITAEGTKKQVVTTSFPENPNLVKVLEELEQSRIIKLEDDVYELSHDSLARKIAEKRNADELQIAEVILLIKNAFKTYQKTESLLDDKQLDLITPLLGKIELNHIEEEFINRSKRSVYFEANKKRKRKLTLIFSLVFTSIMVISFVYIWNKNRIAFAIMRDAKKEMQKARVAKMKADSLRYFAEMRMDSASLEMKKAQEQAEIARQMEMRAQIEKEYALVAEKEAVILKDSAQKQLDLANKFRDAFYFYDGRLAKAEKDGKFGFMNKNGEILIDYQYDYARQFDRETGLAEVTKEGKKYLIDGNSDPLGKEYELAKGLRVMTRETTALDLSGQTLTEIHDMVFMNTQLEVLNLSNNQIRSIPPEIGNLVNLKYLILSDNFITDIPNEIGNLTKLTTLDLRRNLIEELPKEIGDLTNLTFLYLSDTPLRSLPPEIGSLVNLSKLDLFKCMEFTRLPEEIGGLSNLTNFDLGGTQITSLPREIGQLNKLEKLNLNCPVLRSLPAEIGKLTELTSLLLSAPILTILPEEIGNLVNLNILNLSFTNLESLPTEIGKLTKLTMLNLSYTRISNLPDEIGNLNSLFRLELLETPLISLQVKIGKLSNLRSLELSGTLIKSLPAEIGNLQSLTDLFLSGTQLTSLPPEIGQLTNLTSLYLNNAHIDSLPPEIGQLTRLTELDLSGTQITSLPEGIGKLTALNTLYLMYSQITSLPPEIELLTNLTSLYLNNAHIDSLPAEIGQLKALTLLDLSESDIKSLPREIGQLTNLTSLRLWKSQIKSLPPEIGHLTRLTSLALFGTQIKSLPPEIGQLTNLTLLDLSRSDIKSLPPEIGQLTNLDVLYLNNIQTESLPPEIMNLTKLDLIFIPEGVSVEKQKEIEKMLPNCDVEYR